MTLPRCSQAPSGQAAINAAQLACHVPQLETARLKLRAPTLHDLPAWTEIYTREDAVHFNSPFTNEDAWTEFFYYTAGWLLHGHGLLSVELKASNELIGFVFLGLEWDDIEPEMGWMLRSEHRGNGYAQEAARVLRDWGTDLLGSGAFVIYINADHPRSAKVAAALGAKRDTQEEAKIGDGTMVWRHFAPFPGKNTQNPKACP
ncbi:MAG: GNAT family N-acetyltransferase [Pseudomonadota bacterium]